MGDKVVDNVLQKASEVNDTGDDESTRKGWVKFEDESLQDNVPLPEDSTSPGTSAVSTSNVAKTSQPTLPAVLKTETVQINLERSDKHSEPATPRLTKNVEFVSVRQGFCKLHHKTC